MIKLNDPVTELPFVGEKYGSLLRKLEIKTIEDLLNHYPARYEDYSLISKIDKLQAGETATVIGKISEFKYRPTRKKGFSIQEAQFTDNTGELKLTWFNQRFLSSVIKPGIRMSVAGTVKREGNRIAIKNPEYEILRSFPTRLPQAAESGLRNDDNNDKKLASKGVSFCAGNLIHTGRLVPVYPETAGVSSKWIRSRMALVMGILDWYQRKYDVTSQITDWLPKNIVQEEKLINLNTALRIIHFPNNNIELEKARERLGFDELLKMQLEALYRKKQWKVKRKSLIVNHKQSEIENFINRLPFKLTTDQEKSIGDILNDMDKNAPMNRLLQGDVGSGKTVVAAAAAFAAIKCGYQAAFMAPTQVLADQHGETLRALLTPLGIKIALLTGETRNNDEPFPNLIIGTHALIYKRAKKLIDKKRLALVIIDEQHRFGVSQRAQLIASGSNPHVLSMTATPIPRTIALTAYADLDISIIKQMPMGRIPVKTWIVPEFKRENAYRWIQNQIKENKSQTFVVCPLIDESEHESMKQIKAAVAEFNKLKSHFNKLKLGLMHGRMAGKEKTRILTDMREKKIDMLVTTPVVEVGVDIPSATIMVIEAAERFGLAQLHQLRGRVGRSDQPSYCLLFSGNAQKTQRLRAMTLIHNGLELAQLDLKLRGPGEIFATSQHGFAKLKIADLSDINQVRRAHQTAVKLINGGYCKPKLANCVAAN